MLGELDPHVRHTGAGGHVPVDAPDVVTWLVGPNLMELRADACEGRPVVAGKQAVDPPGDHGVERSQIRG